MITWSLAAVVDAVNGKACRDDLDATIAGVSTDSRTLAPGALFVPLTGPNFDGHDYVRAAQQRGAVAALVQREKLDQVRRTIGDDALHLISVDDTLAALQGLAAAYRRTLRTLQVIAVVGSNGKTTTKAMLHHVLSQRWQGSCSPKSFNNAVGVPLTLLGATDGDDYLVVEIGTNAPGEVAALSALAQPNKVVLTSIGIEHLEGLADLPGIAREETSALRTAGVAWAAANVDDPIVDPLLGLQGVELVRFGAGVTASLRLEEITLSDAGTSFTTNDGAAFRLPLLGRHNASNALGVIAAARRLGMADREIAAALATFEPPAQRCQIECWGPVRVINDCYNANPTSVAAALDVLENLATDGRRVLVLGEMLELGAERRAWHNRIAHDVKRRSIDIVILVGAAAELMGDVLPVDTTDAPIVAHGADLRQTGALLARHVADEDTVLIKASRGVALEQLKDHWQAAALNGPR
jgi:UDP-N-acetylmuramoyl-tripeptide--D-alanyl-D-alanine ligase